MKIKLNNLEFFYESYGVGDPVVFIMGLGMDHNGWFLQVPHFVGKFKVIVFDNRGIGRTSVPVGPYTTKQMAEDTVNLLSALDIEQAHIVGISMGGMIAQELAINYPEKVNKLVLSCTYAKPDEKEKELSTENLKQLLGLDVLDFHNLQIDKSKINLTDLYLNIMLPLTLSVKFLKENKSMIKEMFYKFLETNSTLEGFLYQFYATQHHDTLDRLNQIKAPTLVITGDADMLIDKSHSILLQQKINNSKLHIIKDGPHGINIENASEFNKVVGNFLNEKT